MAKEVSQPNYGRITQLWNELLRDFEGDDPNIASLMERLQMQQGFPDLPEDVYGSLNDMYRQGMSAVRLDLEKEAEMASGEVTSGHAARGLTGSSAHGVALGQVQDARIRKLQQAALQLESQRTNQILGLRTGIADRELQQLGLRSGFLSNMAQSRIGALQGLLGTGRLQQEGWLGQQELEAQSNAGIFGMLGSGLSGIGAALPGILSSLFSRDEEDEG